MFFLFHQLFKKKIICQTILTLGFVFFSSKVFPDSFTKNAPCDSNDPAVCEGPGIIHPDESMSTVYVTNSECKLFSKDVPHVSGEYLSYYWAQELIGSDLLKEELRKTPSVPSTENWISVLDTTNMPTEISSHSEVLTYSDIVKSIISGNSPSSILPKIDDQTIYQFDTENYKSYTEFSRNYISTAIHIMHELPVPSFINHSMNWVNRQHIYESFQYLSTGGPVIVTSSGSDSFKEWDYHLYNPPKPINTLKAEASKDFDLIIVGSLSSNGFVNDFSQEEEQVHILSPSDNYIPFINEKGEYQKVYGVNASAPIVTGSLAAFEWISGYHPTAKEAKLLLEKTAIPTIHSHENPRKNGAGLLNTYKLGRVAKRLKEKCKDSGPPCFKSEIENEENYHFPPNPSLESNLLQTFPRCTSMNLNTDVINSNTSENTDKILGTCDGKHEVLNQLRKSIFLNPKDKKLWQILSCIYKDSGLYRNAQILDNIALSTGSREEVIHALNSMVNNNEINSVGGFRAVNNLLEESAIDKALYFLSQKEDIIIQLHLAYMAAYTQEESTRMKIITFLITHGGYPYILQEIIKVAQTVGGKQGSTILNNLALQTSEYSVVESIVKAAGPMGNTYALNHTLYKLSLSPPQYTNENFKNLKILIVQSAEKIGKPGIPILRSLENDPDLDIQELAKNAITKINNL